MKQYTIFTKKIECGYIDGDDEEDAYLATLYRLNDEGLTQGVLYEAVCSTEERAISACINGYSDPNGHGLSRDDIDMP